ncbi:SAM-dependent methyltransferase [Pseudonocardia acaciae]|uniref:SAM-dependent methyltransferase n=1 Tax=Pseudonocardia acaciae TaxID=551276 RepID=UPI00048F3BA7|nr:SAM-dependent methyltransferase [Pseudonocardia acaciae]
MVDQPSRIRFDVPQPARVWNYWMGGSDNYPIDREVGDATAALCPDFITIAKQSRQFLIRTVRHLAAEAGIRQFLDIGTGLPTMQNTHEVAQSVAPESRVVYVDNDPMVLAHARALLTNTTPEGVTTYVEADYRDADAIVADARNVLNFTKPIAVMFMGVLGHTESFDEVRSIVARVVGAVPPGSYLLLWDGTDTSEAARQAAAKQAEMGFPYYQRSPERLARFFEGLELVDPGLVSITRWRPDPVEVGNVETVDAYGALARVPVR